MIEIQVSNSTATLIPPRESLTPGMINAAQVHFTFSDEWVGLEKTAVFSNEIETVPADVVSDTTTLPTEILDAVYRWISVGVTGENGDGDVVIPTIWCRLGQVLPGTSGKYVTQDQLKAYWSKQEIVFILDGDGSRFLGDDGEYHYVAQGGGDVTHEELDDALALKLDKTEAEAEYAKKTDIPSTDDFATKEQLDALTDTIDGKADKTELAGYYSKSDVSIITNGDGKKFLADDGVYRIPESQGVTQGELDAAIAPLATKSELGQKADKSELASYAKQYDVNQALATKADKSEIAELATTEALTAGLATKADNATLSNYALKSELPDTSQLATKSELTTGLAEKASKIELADGLAEKADKDEIITVTTGTGTLFLADDGTYKPAAGDPPDLSAYLTKTEASGTYATKTELADKADVADIADMLTKTEASGTYATKTELADKADVADIADMLTKTEASGTYATKTEVTNSLADKADKSEIITVTTGDGAQFLANDGTYKTVQVDPPDLTPYLTKTDAAAEYATKTELATKANQSEIITVTTGTGTLFLADDGTYKPAAGDPPDLSAYLTKSEAGTIYATKTELGSKADLSLVSALETDLNAKADKSEIPDVSGFVTSTDAATTYATKTELINGLAGKADTSDIITVDDGDGTKYLADDGTYKTVTVPDVSGFETTTHAEATYATKTELAAKADASEMAAALAEKADVTALDDYATKTELGDYATKTELGSKADLSLVSALETDLNAKADKSEIITVTTGDGTQFLANDGTYKTAQVDPPDLTPYLTKTDAAAEYATKTELEAKADDATVTALSGTVTANTAEIATLKTGKADKSELADYETTTHAAETYATKTDISGVIKGIKWGSTSAQVDDDGVAEIGSFALQKTSSAVPGWNTSEWRYIQNIPGVGAEQGVLVAYTRYTEANTVRSLSIFGVRVPTYDEFTEANPTFSQAETDNGDGTVTFSDTWAINDTEKQKFTYTLEASGFASSFTYTGVTQNVRLVTYSEHERDVANMPAFLSRAQGNPSTGGTIARESWTIAGEEKQAFVIIKDGSKITDFRYVSPTQSMTAALATKDWVQEYIASLDANNTGY